MAKRKFNRDEDITGSVDEDELTKLYEDVRKGFEAQRDRSDSILDNWDHYNCQLSPKQFYNGTSELCLPFTHDAVEARVTRFINQIFPLSGRYVEVTTGEADPPQATQALLEHYVRKCKLRTRVMPALLRNGDIEGQYSLYVSWSEHKRRVTSRQKVIPKTGGIPNPAAEPVDDIVEEMIVDAYPQVEVIPDPDLLVLPVTSTSVEDALENGGSVTVIRRWSKGRIKKLIRDGEIKKDKGEEIIEEMNNPRSGDNDTDVAKHALDMAGIKERGKFALVYETWHMLKVGSDERLMCRIYMAGPDRFLGVKRNPFWCDKCPVITAPQDQVAGSIKGVAPVDLVADLQIFANDTINEAADTAHFSAMPIVMTDPLSNPRVDTMALGLGAVWEVSPQTTQFATFPELWKDGIERAAAIREQMFQTLGVNPSMIPQSTGGPLKKRNQAEIANEQQVDIMTTAEAVTGLEEGVLSELMQRFADYDHQFRDQALTVRVYGEMGLKANMEEVEPIQMGERYEFRWFGVEAARNAAQMQQQISWLNVVKEIPPNMYQGYQLNLAPMIVQGSENVFGPRLGPLVFKKIEMISVDPMIENEMLSHGFEVPVNPGDNDAEHMQAHMQVMQSGDPHGVIRKHLMLHQTQMQAKVQSQAANMNPAPEGGAGGGPAAGGQAGPPKMKGAPGAIHPDQMSRAGALVPPRRT